MELAELATALSTIEDWLRQDCPARHAEEMADAVREAFHIVDDLADAGREGLSLCDQCCTGAAFCSCPCHKATEAAS